MEASIRRACMKWPPALETASWLLASRRFKQLDSTFIGPILSALRDWRRSIPWPVLERALAAGNGPAMVDFYQHNIANGVDMLDGLKLRALNGALQLGRDPRGGRAAKIVHEVGVAAHVVAESFRSLPGRPYVVLRPQRRPPPRSREVD